VSEIAGEIKIAVISNKIKRRLTNWQKGLKGICIFPDRFFRKYRSQKGKKQINKK
jgi:hypothetical protein